MIKFILTLFIFLFSINIVLAGDISQFVFTTAPQTIKPNIISEKLTIQAQDAAGNSFNLPQTGCLQLKTTSVSGEFSSSNTSWNPVNILTMNKNTANRNFYYKDSGAGTYTLTINISLRPETETRACASWPVEEWNIQWTTTQNIVVSNDSQSQPPAQTQTTEPEPTSDVGSESWPVEPQIFANAGEDKTGVAGANVYFSGQALGIKKEPIDNARFLWNFGDGASKEGQNISHVYKYPGEYIVVLDIASGKYSASDRALVKIISNQIIISEANKDFIKISNGANVTLDISDWYLRVGDKIFKLPASTLIRANSILAIPSSNSGLEVNNNAELLYPNGSLAYSFVKHSVSNVEPTKVVDLGLKKEDVKESKPENIPAPQVQTANVITVAKKDFWSAEKWWGLVVVTGILSSAGFLFIRRKLV